MHVLNDVILEESILDTLKYFDFFRHPLYMEEVHKFLRISVDRDSLSQALDEMVRSDKIYTHKGMYSLEDTESIFIKRIVGSDIAAEKIKDAKRSAAIIASFPFVKGVCISGSLSKGYADEQSDIDFFVITKSRRLWICRSFLHLFKKLTFFINRQHSFCMNYFIDEERMCLDEKNIFTATEIKTLIPIYNLEACNDFQSANDFWTKKLLPNATINYDSVICVKCVSPVKNIAEKILNNIAPIKFNNALMKLTDMLWRRKWRKKNYPMHDYDLAMKTRWYVSKNHPINYQKKILESTAY